MRVCHKKTPAPLVVRGFSFHTHRTTHFAHTVRYTENVMDLFNGTFYKFFFSFIVVVVVTLGVILVVGGSK